MKTTISTLILIISFFYFNQNYAQTLTYDWAQNIATGKLEIDNSGNIYKYNGISGGGFNITKLDAAGNIVWNNTIGTANASFSLMNIALEKNTGNLYAYCRLGTGTVDVDPSPNTFNLSPSFLLIKYDANGILLWAFNLYTNASNYGSQYAHVKLDGNNDVCISGSYRNTVDFDPGAGTVNITSGSSYDDCFIAKYSGSGQFIWVKSMGNVNSLANDLSIGLEIDKNNGNIYLMGSIGGSSPSEVGDIDPGVGVVNLNPGYFLAKYDLMGNYISYRGLPVLSPFTGARIVTAFDDFENFYISSIYESSITFDAVLSTGSSNTRNLYLVKLACNNNFAEVFSINLLPTSYSTGNDRASILQTDISGNVYSFIHMNCSPVTNRIIFAKYDTNGTPIFTQPILDNAGNTSCYGNESVGLAIFNSDIYISAGGYAADYDISVGTNVLSSALAKYSFCQSTSSQPSSIAGNNVICPGQVVTYSVVNDPSASSYSWNIPAGWSGTSNTNSITTTANSTSGNVSVTAINACGNSSAQSLFINVNSNTSSTISPTVCNSYTAPDGAVYTSSGTYSALIANAGGCDSTITINLTIISSPSQPSTITGNPVVCPGQVVTYSVTNDPSTTSYSWSVPAGWSILPPSNTNSITLAVGGSTGVISVTANNSCGSSTAQTFNVVVSTPPIQPSTVVGNTTVCSGTLNTYSVTNDANALSYTWTLPLGWSGSSTTNSIAATAGTTSGNVSVVANYFCGTSAPSSISVNVNVPPAQPSTISGLTEFCEDNLSQNYSVTNDAAATSYTWTLPGGWSGTSATNSIITTASTNGGTITVIASNSCGNSPAQTETIVVNPLPTVNFVQDPSLVCINYAPFELSLATPAGGNYSGFGVNGTTFDPTTAGIGNHLISYFYTDANGCSDMATDIITVDDCAGIEEKEVDDIIVFPNPTNGWITIQSEKDEIEEIIIYDLTGKLIKKIEVSGLTIALDMQEYATGVYRLICLSNNSLSVVKLIKQ